MTHWLLDLTVFKKILLPVSILTASIVIIIAVNAHSLHKISASATSIIDHDVKRSLVTLDMKVEVNNATVAALSSLLSRTPAEIDLAEQRYQTSINRLGATLDEAAALESGPERRAVVEELRAKLARYDGLTRTAMGHVRAGEPAAAAEIWLGDGRAARLAFDDAVQQRLEVDQQAMREAVGAMDAETSTTILEGFALGLGLTLAALGVLYLIVSRLVTNPLSRLSAAVDRLNKGDIPVEVVDGNRKDEIGHIAQAVRMFREAQIERRAIEQSDRDRMATSDYRTKAVGALMQKFRTRSSEVLTQVQEAHDSLSATARQLSSTADISLRRTATVAAATQQATANVQSVASAAEQLSASIREIGRQVEQSSKLSAAATDEAKATDTTVRGLANQTAKATEEISAQIGAVQSSTQQAVTAIGGIVARIEEISAIAASIAAAVDQQSAATTEIARNVQQAARGTQEVADAIGDAHEASAETDRATNAVLACTDSLAESNDALRTDVETFLNEMRDAVSKTIKAAA